MVVVGYAVQGGEAMKPVCMEQELIEDMFPYRRLCECCGKKPVAEGFRKLCKDCFKRNGDAQDLYNKKTTHSITGKS